MEWSSANWHEFYPDAKEALPSNAPKLRGQPVQLNLFCDAAHYRITISNCLEFIATSCAYRKPCVYEQATTQPGWKYPVYV